MERRLGIGLGEGGGGGVGVARSGAAVRSCTIITTSANAQLSPIHHRMPVILPRDLEEFWLDTDVQEPSFLSQVLVPYPDNELDTYEVSTLVNSAANDGPAVIQPIT